VIVTNHVMQDGAAGQRTSDDLRDGLRRLANARRWTGGPLDTEDQLAAMVRWAQLDLSNPTHRAIVPVEVIAILEGRKVNGVAPTTPSGDTPNTQRVNGSAPSEQAQVRFGATLERWDYWAGIAPECLLPVVSDPTVPVAEASALAKTGARGKVPSKIANGVVWGIGKWTELESTPAMIAAWRVQPAYGICVRTGHGVEALDCDITDEQLAQRVEAFITARYPGCAVRYRTNSSKFLVPLRVAGDGTQKCVLKTEHGNIEWLATGQQFIAEGTHSSGARIEWRNTELPALTRVEVEQLLAELQAEFGVAPEVKQEAAREGSGGNGLPAGEARAIDPIARFLDAHDWVLDSKPGRLFIRCPFEDQHSGPSNDATATSYFVAGVGDYAQGHWKCLHSHCANRKDFEFEAACGYTASLADVFEDVSALYPEPVKPLGTEQANPFRAYRWSELGDLPIPEWLIKDILPAFPSTNVYEAVSALMIAMPDHGKTYVAVSMIGAILHGRPWCGRPVQQGPVLVIAAEDSTGIRQRIQAWHNFHGLTVPDDRLRIIPAAPNFFKGDKDTNLVIQAIEASGMQPALIVIDVLANTIRGANEDKSLDMGLVNERVNRISARFRSVVLLIHHSVKANGKVSRGSGSIPANVNAEIFIEKKSGAVCVTTGKVKQANSDTSKTEIWMDWKRAPVVCEGGVVEEVSLLTPADSAKPHAKDPPIPRGQWQRKVMRVLTDISHGGTAQPTQEAVIRTVVAKSAKDDEGKDRRREYARRAMNELEERRLLEFVDDCVRLTVQGSLADLGEEEAQ
jgi:hypothetical protein